MEHYPNRTEREWIHLHFVLLLFCDTIHFHVCSNCFLCYCCLIFIGLFHNFSHLKLPSNILSIRTDSIYHEPILYCNFNEFSNNNTAISTCDYVYIEWCNRNLNMNALSVPLYRDDYTVCNRDHHTIFEMWQIYHLHMKLIPKTNRIET